MFRTNVKNSMLHFATQFIEDSLLTRILSVNSLRKWPNVAYGISDLRSPVSAHSYQGLHCSLATSSPKSGNLNVRTNLYITYLNINKLILIKLTNSRYRTCHNAEYILAYVLNIHPKWFCKKGLSIQDNVNQYVNRFS